MGYNDRKHANDFFFFSLDLITVGSIFIIKIILFVVFKKILTGNVILTLPQIIKSSEVGAFREKKNRHEFLFASRFLRFFVSIKKIKKISNGRCRGKFAAKND